MNVLEPVPLLYARSELEAELARADWRLQALLLVSAGVARDLGWLIRITSVERTVERTREIYERAGRPPPAGPGVHDVRPTRGADGELVRLHSAARPDPHLPLEEVGPAIALRVNGIVQYPRGKRAVLWHDVAGRHLHNQVPPEGLVLLADPNRLTTLA